MPGRRAAPRPTGSASRFWRRLFMGRHGDPLAFRPGICAGLIVGCIANVPTAYLWKGRLIRVANQCDWAVDPEYRPFSLLLMQRIMNQPDVDLILTTTVGATAEPSFAAFKWHRVPAGRWD